MKLLVTGGAGFIGSHFIRSWLAGHPSDFVVNLDALTYAGSRERLTDLESQKGKRYQFLHGTVCDPAIVREAIAGCQTVVHFAAETHVDRSITDAVPFVRTNVEGTSVVLHEARAGGVQRFIHVSTDEVYGPIAEGEVDEGAPLAPHSPYAASKAAGDLLVQAFRATYGFPAIVVRPTNIFGPAQFPEKFIPLCITNASDRVRIPIYGDGQQRRAWLFVNDLCEALRVIIERGNTGEVYNVASGCEQTNLETAKMIVTRMDRPTTLIQLVNDRPGHDRRYAMCDAKLRSLGWQPATSFDAGLAETIAWYLEHIGWWRPPAKRLREGSYHWLNRPAGSGIGQPFRPNV
jgi:dTDP-glucose 4,6-dehydratase